MQAVRLIFSEYYFFVVSLFFLVWWFSKIPLCVYVCLFWIVLQIVRVQCVLWCHFPKNIGSIRLIPFVDFNLRSTHSNWSISLGYFLLFWVRAILLILSICFWTFGHSIVGLISTCVGVCVCVCVILRICRMDWKTVGTRPLSALILLYNYS